ncbi:hypothetical protein [Corynebacterium macginleyi]|uniref:hypothetical protein n=1 Tax=Corynebacterium macginleyi TaxID=38290 RepID=UPI000EF9F63C|nr:hypothetical protein [Corynebacterium macginleyi]MBK4163186.1 hypothetical protein [Corynebacterium macginleyi]QRJ58318.1 hypothetical protein GWO64_002630 [Corynebacterium macginleyi]QRP21783.1 hypothetical protein I6J25_02820 [Corynebacterium macginleyi]RMB69083.1 hypothetical protein D9V82_01075 [Corynebacterium macginleyi]
MTTSLPAAVTRRKRLVLGGDVFLGLSIVAAALHFFALGLSNLLWPIVGIAATFCTMRLRHSIRHLDAPTTEMDEYELRLHTEARDKGLKTAVSTSIALFLVAGATASVLRFFGAEQVAMEEATSGNNIAIFFAKLIYLQLLWVPFAVVKELATKLNTDELRSAEN